MSEWWDGFHAGAGLVWAGMFLLWLVERGRNRSLQRYLDKRGAPK